MRRFLRSQQGFLSLLGILLTMCFVVFLSYIVFNVYLKKSPINNSAEGKAFQNMAKEAGVNTSDYQSILESTTQKIHQLEKQELERPGQIFDEAQRQATPGGQ